MKISHLLIILIVWGVQRNIAALCGQSHEKSIASLLLGNFGIGIGVHPSTLQIKKKIDAKVCHLPYR